MNSAHNNRIEEMQSQLEVLRKELARERALMSLPGYRTPALLLVGMLGQHMPYEDSPVPRELARLRQHVGGNFEASTDAIFLLLSENALAESKADPRWPVELYELGIALRRTRGHCARLGMRVQYRSKRAHGRRWKITRIEPSDHSKIKAP